MRCVVVVVPMTGALGSRTENGAWRRVVLFWRDLLFFLQAEDGIRDLTVTGVQTCALPIYPRDGGGPPEVRTAADGGHQGDPAATDLEGARAQTGRSFACRDRPVRRSGRGRPD